MVKKSNWTIFLVEYLVGNHRSMKILGRFFRSVILSAFNTPAQPRAAKTDLLVRRGLTPNGVENS